MRERQSRVAALQARDPQGLEFLGGAFPRLCRLSDLSELLIVTGPDLSRDESAGPRLRVPAGPSAPMRRAAFHLTRPGRNAVPPAAGGMAFVQCWAAYPLCTSGGGQDDRRAIGILVVC